MTVKFKVKVHNKSFIIEIICSNKNNVTIGGIKEAVASSEEISKVLSGCVPLRVIRFYSTKISIIVPPVFF